MFLILQALALCIIHCGVHCNLALDDNFNREWSVISGRMSPPKCVDIPSNMSLCHGIGYEKMRLPNLLDHENLQEATNHASNWNALLGIRCHSDTQVFLCSLFSPVCLERVIYPCRSLCQGVRDGCEKYMKSYGFPWPEIFRCDKFPVDDDLCIPARSGERLKQDDRICKPCQEPDTYEGILHNYCKSSFVIRAKLKGINRRSKSAAPGEVEVDMGKGKKKFYKRDTEQPKKVLREIQGNDAKVYIKQGIGCSCEGRITEGEYHLMAISVEEKFDSSGQKTNRFYADFITSWKDEGSEESTKVGIRKALRALRKSENVCKGGLSTLNIHKEAEDEMQSEVKARQRV